MIVDDKTALVDTVLGSFAPELLANIEQVCPGKLDYVIVNHIEPDHSGALPQVMARNPDAIVVCTARAREGLDSYYGGNWRYHIVKSGDSIELGRHTLQFIETPMLHWPDNMVTYVPQKKLLLSNDAFGQHLAWSHPFDDDNDLDIIMTEAAKYYANILTPFSRIVAKKLDEIANLNIEIEMIAPSHGVIWRRHGGKILSAYSRWAAAEANPRVLVVYDTMWGAPKMARAVLEGWPRPESARLFKASVSDRNDIVAELLEAKGILWVRPPLTTACWFPSAQCWKNCGP